MSLRLALMTCEPLSVMSQMAMRQHIREWTHRLWNASRAWPQRCSQFV